MNALLLLIILGTVVISSDVPTSTASRSCPGRLELAPCSEFWIHDTVFIGTVKQLVIEPFPEGTGRDYQQYRKVTAILTVEETFRGNLGPEVVFEMEDCYFEFVKGEKYLIYTNKGQGGKLALRRDFGRTRLVSEAREDLDYIRSLPDAPPGGRIFGTVYDHRESVTLRVNNESYPVNNTMAGVTIYLRNRNGAFQTVSDATGYYEFTRVPPGEYELSTDLPEYLSGSRHPVKVIDKGCENVRMSIQATGEIKGRLVNSNGEPVQDAVISIFSSDGVSEDMFERVKASYMTRAETDRAGSFRFVRLPGGKYHLAVNMLDQERKQNSEASKYPRIFYPGVESFKDAKPIVVPEGAALNQIEFKLPALPASP